MYMCTFTQSRGTPRCNLNERKNSTEIVSLSILRMTSYQSLDIFYCNVREVCVVHINNFSVSTISLYIFFRITSIDNDRQQYTVLFHSKMVVDNSLTSFLEKAIFMMGIKYTLCWFTLFGTCKRIYHYTLRKWNRVSMDKYDRNLYE